jgi:hypothetical protein
MNITFKRSSTRYVYYIFFLFTFYFNTTHQFLQTFPEFQGFDDRYWPPRALLYVALKGTSDSWRKDNPELAAARTAQRTAARAAAKVHKKRGKPNPKGRPKGKAKTTGKSKAQGTAATSTAEGEDIHSILNTMGNMSIDPGTYICTLVYSNKYTN